MCKYLKTTSISVGAHRANRRQRPYIEVVGELKERFSHIDDIATVKDKKEFAKLFSEYLRIENVLQNYDECSGLTALKELDMDDAPAVEAFQATYNISDEAMVAMQAVETLDHRALQDYRSTYNDICDWLRSEKAGKEKEQSGVDWDDVVFEIDLLNAQEMNLDYILELIFEKNKKSPDKTSLVEDVRRLIRSSVGNRAKESLVVEFIHRTDLDKIADRASIIDAFFTFAQGEQKREGFHVTTYLFMY